MGKIAFQGKKGAKPVKNAGIIAEYDPFHAGHAWQIAEARRQGAETATVCMSGDVTQRGGAALLPPSVRAAAALGCGADLVLCLPNPYACLSAEGFAAAGVAVLSALPSLDTLVFGAETPDTAALVRTAGALCSKGFSAALARRLAGGTPFAAARAAAAEEVCPGAGAVLAGPNNNLGVEYCKALAAQNSHLSPLALPRRGAAHGEAEPGAGGFASASSLRTLWRNGGAAALEGYVPEAALALYKEAEAAGADLDEKAWGVALLSRLRGMDAAAIARTRGTAEGLEHLLENAVRAAADLPGLHDAMKSKRYAHARLRRYVLAAALGYTEALPALPPYVHVLAANRRGLALLRGANKPAGASLARLSRENEACRAAAAAHAAAADLAALCRRAPGPMGGCYTEKPLLVC